MDPAPAPLARPRRSKPFGRRHEKPILSLLRELDEGYARRGEPARLYPRLALAKLVERELQRDAIDAELVSSTDLPAAHAALQAGA